MGTIPTTSDAITATSRPLTVADLAVLPAELPSGPAVYELENGRLVIMSPPGFAHGAAEAAIAAAFYVQGDLRGLGRTVSGETGVVLWRDPDRVVGVDVAFFVNQSLPLRLSAEGYVETIPDLVVEVKIKNDSPNYIRGKVQDYLTAGVRVVWTVDPATKLLVEYRRDTAPRTYQASDTVTLEDLLPGFALPLANLFLLPS